MDPALPRTILSLTEANKKKQNLIGTVDGSRLCDLSDEILIDILGRLDSLSRVRFSAVCMTWRCYLRMPLAYVADAQDLTWFLTIDFCNYSQPVMLQKPGFLSLHDQKPCTTINCDLKDPINGIPPKSIKWHRVMGTQFGWTVFRLDYCSTDDESFLGDNNIFLYSPFTEKFIFLPPHPYNIGVPVDVFTMSHPPTCSDCVFFVFSSAHSYDFRHDEPCIYTCCHGDNKWKKHNIDLGRLWLESVTFLGGTFYCKLYNGGLAAFKPADGSWQVLTDFEPPQEHYYSYRCCLTASDGEVLLVYHNRDIQWGSSFSIWRYQWTKRAWQKMESLGGRALFLNNCGPVTTVAALVGVEPFADRIYFSHPHPCYVPFRHRESHDHSITVVNRPKGRCFWIMAPPFVA